MCVFYIRSSSIKQVENDKKAAEDCDIVSKNILLQLQIYNCCAIIGNKKK